MISLKLKDLPRIRLRSPLAISPFSQYPTYSLQKSSTSQNNSTMFFIRSPLSLVFLVTDQHLFLLEGDLLFNPAYPLLRLVIKQLNPIINGWSRYYTPGVSRKVFERLDNHMYYQLWGWAITRHPNKGARWIKRKYFRQKGNDNWKFMTQNGIFLSRHSDHPIKRHVKVVGTSSPFDGNWPYWSTRLTKMPKVSSSTAKLLKRQQGKCEHCKLWFRSEDLLEIHHKDRDPSNNKTQNLSLLHRHCHDDLHGASLHEKRLITEEPYELKGSRTVLKSSGRGQPLPLR